MGRVEANAGAARSFPAKVIAVAFLCGLSAGCGNSCVGFFSNPGVGILSVNVDTCQVKDQDNGNVRLRFSAPPDSVEAWRTAGIKHIFLTVRGIEARLKPDSSDDSVDWHDLTPNLKEHPVQVDLLAGDDPSSPDVVDFATLPVGEYTQIRIRLVRDAMASAESTPEENACATASFNCAVTRDGVIHFLDMPSGQLVVSPTEPNGAVFYVLRNTTSNLDLQFIPAASQIYTLGQSAWFDPRFNARWTFSPASTDPAIAVLPH